MTRDLSYPPLGARTCRTQYVVPLTGDTVVYSGPDTLLVLDPAGALADLTITVPSVGLKDGHRVIAVSTFNITTVTFNGGTFAGSVATLAANTARAFTYSAAAAKWFRTQ